MSELPQGWRLGRLGDVVEVLDSKRIPVSAKERAERLGPVPYYGATGRVGSIDTALFDEDLVLLGEDGVQFFDPNKAKAYAIAGPSWVNNHAHVLRPKSTMVELRFLVHALNAADYHGYANGTTRLKLTQAAMRTLLIPLPPLAEQRRIVDVLEGHLSRLDAAQSQASLSLRKLYAYRSASLMRLTHNLAGSHQVVLSEISSITLGRQRSPKNHVGDRMTPYLRAANVDWNTLRLDDVKYMHFSENEAAAHRLEPGDILLTEASGSPREVGKSTLYRGEVLGACIQNTLLRVRCSDPGVVPDFLQKYLLAEAMAGRFVPESRGVGIAHLGRSRLASLRIDLPDVTRQRSALAAIDRAVDAEIRLRDEVVVAQARGQALRRALLQTAFTGRLTGASGELAEQLAAV